MNSISNIEAAQAAGLLVDTNDRASIARASRIDAIARILAADRMGLVRDPLGSKLPEDFWLQCRAQAEAVMLLVGNRP